MFRPRYMHVSGRRQGRGTRYQLSSSCLLTRDTAVADLIPVRDLDLKILKSSDNKLQISSFLATV
jgi:hypothetical protein